MREHATLRRPGGARRVDERERVLGLDGVDARLQVAGVAGTAPLAQVVERDRAGVRVGARGVDHDDVPEVWQVLADGDDLRDLLGVLADDRDGLRVARHPLTFLGRVGLVDRDHDRTRRGRAEVREGPLGARIGEDADAVAALDAEVDQAEADLAHDLPRLRVVDVLPLVCDLVAREGSVAVELRGPTEEVGHRLRAGGDRRGRSLHELLLLDAGQGGSMPPRVLLPR
jgi:hypothetical protein